MLNVSKAISQGFSPGQFKSGIEHDQAMLYEMTIEDLKAATTCFLIPGLIAAIWVGIEYVYDYCIGNTSSDKSRKVTEAYIDIQDKLIITLEGLSGQGVGLDGLPVTVYGENGNILKVTEKTENGTRGLEFIFNNKTPVFQPNMSFDLLHLMYKSKVSVFTPNFPQKVNPKAWQQYYLNNFKSYPYYLQNTPSRSFADGMRDFEFNEELNSIRIISTLSAEDAEKVAFNRDVVHTHGTKNAEDEKANHSTEKLLRTKGSAIRLGGTENNPYIAEDAQVSIAMKTTFVDKDGTVTHPTVLSVSAAAMDDTHAISGGKDFVNRPEMSTYLTHQADGTYTFDEDKFKKGRDTLGNHVLTQAQLGGHDEVVMSAFGIGAFLDGLKIVDAINAGQGRPSNYYENAVDMAANSLAQTIKALRVQGKKVSFSDVYDTKMGQFKTSIFWNKVNAELSVLDEKKFLPVNEEESHLGGGWTRDSQLIVNSWDPDSLIGNGMSQDPTFDGYFGRASSAQFVHAAACYLHNGGVLPAHVNSKQRVL